MIHKHGTNLGPVTVSWSTTVALEIVGLEIVSGDVQIYEKNTQGN
jgi:hypothetical protein